MKERKRQSANPSNASIAGPAPGAQMVITGLVNRPELNGVQAKVKRYIPSKDRWLVELNDGKGSVVVKATNLKHA